MAVRETLLSGSCSVSVQPLVWQWVRNMDERGFFGWNWAICCAHRTLPALSLATSVTRSMPMPQKKLNRGANWSTFRPAPMPAFT